MDTKKEVVPQSERAPSSITTTERVSKLRMFAATLKAAVDELKLGFVTLSESGRKATFRPPAGVEAPASALAVALGNDPESAAKVPQVGAEEMFAKVRFLGEANDVRAKLTALLRRLDDTELVVREELFQSSAVIRRLAKLDPETSLELVEAVKVFDEFLSRARRTPKPEDDPVVDPIDPLVPFSNGHANGSE